MFNLGESIEVCCVFYCLKGLAKDAKFLCSFVPFSLTMKKQLWGSGAFCSSEIHYVKTKLMKKDDLYWVSFKGFSLSLLSLNQYSFPWMKQC